MAPSRPTDSAAVGIGGAILTIILAVVNGTGNAATEGAAITTVVTFLVGLLSPPPQGPLLH